MSHRHMSSLCLSLGKLCKSPVHRYRSPVHKYNRLCLSLGKSCKSPVHSYRSPEHKYNRLERCWNHFRHYDRFLPSSQWLGSGFLPSSPLGSGFLPSALPSSPCLGSRFLPIAPLTQSHQAFSKELCPRGSEHHQTFSADGPARQRETKAAFFSQIKN